VTPVDDRPKIPFLLRMRGWLKRLIGEIGGNPAVYRDGMRDAQIAKEKNGR
jgi:hypothetical protein